MAIDCWDELIEQSADAEEVGSTTFIQQAWRQMRNERLTHDSEANQTFAGEPRLCKREGIFLTSQPSTLGTQTPARCTTMPGHYSSPSTATTLFWRSRMTRTTSGQYCPSSHCDLADRHNSIWDWKTRRKMNKFSNQNVAGSSISSIHFVNEMANSLMLTASSEAHRPAREAGR